MMRKTTMLAAVMMIGFWGVMGAVALIRSLNTTSQRILANFAAPMAVILTLVLLFWFLRRRAARRRVAPTLEDIRRLSRQRMATEPDDEHFLVRPPRERACESPCAKMEAAQADGEGVGPDANTTQPPESRHPKS